MVWMNSFHLSGCVLSRAKKRYTGMNNFAKHMCVCTWFREYTEVITSLILIFFELVCVSLCSILESTTDHLNFE